MFRTYVLYLYYGVLHIYIPAKREVSLCCCCYYSYCVLLRNYLVIPYRTGNRLQHLVELLSRNTEISLFFSCERQATSTRPNGEWTICG